MEHMHIERWVNLAIVEDSAWQAEAHPSYRTGPRVLLRTEDGLPYASRRPFRRGGHWCVRNGGTARLTDPKRDEFSGHITFLPRWSW